jgi:hypothetical protein
MSNHICDEDIDTSEAWLVATGRNNQPVDDHCLNSDSSALKWTKSICDLNDGFVVSHGFVAC